VLLLVVQAQHNASHCIVIDLTLEEPFHGFINMRAKSEHLIERWT
jgi:hypothetical protein